MKPSTASLFFLLLCVAIAQAQYRELVGKPYNQRLDAIDRLYRNVIDSGIPEVQLADTLAGMRTLADRLGDKELRLEADLLDAIYDDKVGSGSPDKLLLTLEEAEHEGVAHVACRAVWSIGQHHWMAGRYEQGFRWYLRLNEMLRELDVAVFPDKVNYLEEIGRAYYRFGDYGKAIPYFEQVAALPIRDFYLNRWRHAINTMGLAYRELGQWDRSDACFRRLVDHATEMADEQWDGLASGNLGHNLYLQGNYSEAIPLFEKDIRVAEQYDDLGLAAGSAIPMADILTQRGQTAEAKVYIDKALDYIRRSEQADRLRLLYPVMSKWHTAQGERALAAQYLDSALAANKHFAEKFNALKLMRANQEITAGQQEAALQRLRGESARQRLVRNGIIGGLLVALAATLIIYRAIVSRNRTQRRLQDMELEQTRQQLDNARRLLDGYTYKIHQNSRILQSMERIASQEVDDHVLEQLRTSTILTEKDWEDFREQFHKLYPGFTDKLLARHPDLTRAEVRYLTLLRLELSHPEIAHALGISPASLRVTWHRLRKKLGLSNDHTPAVVYTAYFTDF